MEGTMRRVVRHEPVRRDKIKNSIKQGSGKQKETTIQRRERIRENELERQHLEFVKKRQEEDLAKVAEKNSHRMIMKSQIQELFARQVERRKIASRSMMLSYSKRIGMQEVTRQPTSSLYSKRNRSSTTTTISSAEVARNLKTKQLELDEINMSLADIERFEGSVLTPERRELWHNTRLY